MQSEWDLDFRQKKTKLVMIKCSFRTTCSIGQSEFKKLIWVKYGSLTYAMKSKSSSGSKNKSNNKDNKNKNNKNKNNSCNSNNNNNNNNSVPRVVRVRKWICCEYETSKGPSSSSSSAAHPPSKKDSLWGSLSPIKYCHGYVSKRGGKKNCCCWNIIVFFIHICFLRM